MSSGYSADDRVMMGQLARTLARVERRLYRLESNLLASGPEEMVPEPEAPGPAWGDDGIPVPEMAAPPDTTYVKVLSEIACTLSRMESILIESDTLPVLKADAAERRQRDAERVFSGSLDPHTRLKESLTAMEKSWDERDRHMAAEPVEVATAGVVDDVLGVTQSVMAIVNGLAELGRSWDHARFSELSHKAQCFLDNLPDPAIPPMPNRPLAGTIGDRIDGLTARMDAAEETAKDAGQSLGDARSELLLLDKAVDGLRELSASTLGKASATDVRVDDVARTIEGVRDRVNQIHEIEFDSRLATMGGKVEQMRESLERFAHTLQAGIDEAVGRISDLERRR